MNDHFWLGIQAIKLDIKKLLIWSYYMLRVAVIVLTGGRCDIELTRNDKVISKLWGHMTNEEKSRLKRLSHGSQPETFLGEIERLCKKYNVVE